MHWFAVGSSLHQSPFERIGPGVAKWRDWRLDHRAPLMFDAEGIAAGDLADFARLHIVLSRNCKNGGKVFGRDGNDGASAAFGEEGELDGKKVVETDGCAEGREERFLASLEMTVVGLVAKMYAVRRGGRAWRKRTGLKTGHYRRGGEAGFGESDGEAAVGNVVGGFDGALGREGNEAVDKTLLGGEVDGGRFAGDERGDGF